jgi:gamma-glutamyltranspeptidase/glutathione hydrolase
MEALQLHRYAEAAAAFLIEGQRAPRVGEVMKLPQLAASLKLIAKNGRDAFYKGPIAQKIVAYSKTHGGYFSLPDFADHKDDWVAPVSTNYRGYDVWELPPNGQGIAALEMLNLLEGYDLGKMGFGSVDHLHLFVEAKKLAFADRARYYADPAFAEVPVKALISKNYANERRKLIRMDKAAKVVEPGAPEALKAGDTKAGIPLFVNGVGGPGAYERRSDADKKMNSDNVASYQADATTKRPRPVSKGL